MMVGRLLSYWEGNFSEAMLNFGRVFRILNLELLKLLQLDDPGDRHAMAGLRTEYSAMNLEEFTAFLEKYAVQEQVP